MKQVLISDSFKDIVKDSIDACQRILNSDENEVLELLIKNNARINSMLRRHIAKRVVRYFTLSGINVISAYVFGSTDHETAGYFSDIDVILHVDKNKREYKEVITKVNDKITEEIAKKIGKLFPKKFKILDVKLVTEKDIDNKAMYACLINSAYDPACKVY